jgi:serine/threonine protein kinase
MDGSRKSTRLRQTGGKFLAAGQYGCVFMPTLKEKEVIGKLPTNDKVLDGTKLDKLMLPEEADLEFGIAKKIQAIPNWKDYFLVAEAMFIPASKQKEKDLEECEPIGNTELSKLRILRMTYGGTPLNKFSTKFHNFQFDRFVRHLLEAVVLLTLHGISHLDLHSANILVDNHGMPRIIDFNLSVDARSTDIVVDKISHKYMSSLMQEPPDSTLLTAISRKKAGDDVPNISDVVDDIMKEKTILKTARSVLGMTEKEQRQGMINFLETSKAVRNGDLELWYRTYWRVNDSWAFATNIIVLINRMMLFKAFEDRWGPEVMRIRGTLTKMMNTNPRERYDAVQALYEMYPQSPFLTKPEYKNVYELIIGWLAQVQQNKA